MQHLGTTVLQTPRLILRRFSIEDAGAVYANWASDPEVTAYMPWAAHDSVETSKEVLADWVEGYGKADYYNWAITVRENGTDPVGSISIPRKDDRVQKMEVGYCIGRKWWNQGIMTEALGRVMDFLLTEAGVNRLEAMHDTRNPGSGKVMVKCGMRYEGTLRQAGKNNGGICDMAVYAILKGEYKGGTP